MIKNFKIYLTNNFEKQEKRQIWKTALAAPKRWRQISGTKTVASLHFSLPPPHLAETQLTETQLTEKFKKWFSCKKISKVKMF